MSDPAQVHASLTERIERHLANKSIEMPFARLLHRCDLLANPRSKLDFAHFLALQPPEPRLHMVDFLRPEKLKPVDSVVEFVLDDGNCSTSAESASASITNGLDDEDYLIMAGVRDVGPPSASSFMTLARPTLQNFWRTSDRVEWNDTTMDISNISAGVSTTRTNQPFPPGSKMPFIVTCNGFAKNVPSLILERMDNVGNNLMSLEIVLWRKITGEVTSSTANNHVSMSPCLKHRQQSHFPADGNFKLNLELRREHEPGQFFTILHCDILLSLHLFQGVSANIQRDMDYVEHAAYTFSLSSFISNCIKTAKEGLQTDIILSAGKLSLLVPPETVLEALSSASNGRLMLVATFHSDSISDARCIPSWFSDPFMYGRHYTAPVGDLVPFDILVQHNETFKKHNWMKMMSAYSDAFFHCTIKRQQPSVIVSAAEKPTIAFTSLHNYLLFIMRKFSRCYAVLPKAQLWQFILECLIVRPLLITESDSRKCSPATVTNLSHMQLSFQGSEHINRAKQQSMCRVDLATFRRVIFQFSKLLYHIALENEQCQFISNLFAHGYVSLGSPPMIHLLNSAEKFWFSLDPCRPFEVSISGTLEENTECRHKMDWRTLPIIPESITMFDMYCSEQSSGLPMGAISLWCGELGNVCVSKISDSHLISLLRGLNLTTFYGVDPMTNRVKRSTVAHLTG